MKNIDFKKSFSFVLAFINEIKYKPIEKKWEELLLPNGKNDNLEVCSGHKYDFSKCNFASLSELYELRESLILPFFFNLHNTSKSSVLHDTDSDVKGIASLLDDPCLSEIFPSKEDIILFGEFCKSVLRTLGQGPDNLVQACLQKIGVNLLPYELDHLKLQALSKLNEEFKLNVAVASEDKYLGELRGLSRAINIKKGNLEVKEKSLDDTEKEQFDNTKKIEDAEKAIVSLSHQKKDVLESQYILLKYVATLYAHGNQHYKLKPHKRNDFDKIFGPYLCFNDGNPEIIEQNGSFDFKAVLEGIVENCQRERTFLAVMGKKLQAGKIAEVLVKEANAFARGTRLRNIQGDVRKNISFRAVWDDGRSPVPFLNQAIGETGTFLDNCKKNQAHLNEVLSAKKDNLDKAKEELGLLTGKMDRIAGELKQEIFKCEDLFGPVIQKIIKHEKNEKNKQQSKAREKERLKIVEELSREVTRVVSHSSSFSKVVDELKENITGHLSNDLKVVIDCTLKIESNDELTLLHRLLAWRYPFLKSFKGNEPSCFTTMSGQKEACSGEWGVIEFTLAKCMFANAEKSSGLVSIPELILQNPFLKLYGHLQPTVEGSAQADVVDGAGASAAGISTEVKDVERELKAATAASRLISNIDAKLGGGKESKKEDLELIRAQVQSISDNRVLEKLFTWLMTQEYLWKTTGFSFTKTTMFGVEQYCRSTWGKIEQFFAKKMTTNSCRAALHGEHGTKGIDELVKGNPFLNKHRSLIEKMQKNFSLDDKESEAEGRIFERQQSTETSSIESSLDVSYASM